MCSNLIKYYRLIMMFWVSVTFMFTSLLSVGCVNKQIQINPISQKFGIDLDHLETTIVVNPSNPENIVVGSMISNGGNNIEYSVIYYSLDKGATWHQGLNLESGSSAFPNGDPYLTADSHGNIYFTTLYNGFTVWRSTDLGASWIELSTVPGSGAYDRQWLAAYSKDKFKHLVFASGKFRLSNVTTNVWPEAIAISRSTDNGTSFSSPQTFLPATSNEGLNAPTGLHLTKNGRLLASYNMFYLDSIPQKLFPLDKGIGTEIIGKIEVLVSEDDGQTFNRYFVSPYQTFRFDDLNKGWSCLATGGMASFTSNNVEIIYITWIQAIAGYCRQVVASSSDGGKTWSKKTLVKNSAKDKTDISNPNIAVNHNGHLLAIWSERIMNNDVNCFLQKGAFSVDNGQTFGEPFLIDDNITCPCKDDNKKLMPHCRFLNGGDTQGISSLDDGSFVLVYPSERENKLELFIAKISLQNE